MENLNLMLFIALSIPLLLLLLLSDQKRNILFLLFGMVVCLFCGELNAILLQTLPLPLTDFTVNISPVTEEVCKAIPVLVFAFLYHPDRRELLPAAASLGVGFALLESAYTFASALGQMTMLSAVIRGLGCGIGHGASTALVGWGVGFVHTKRKLFYTGTIAVLSCSILFHAVYNDLVSAGYLLPATVFPGMTVLLLVLILQPKKKGSLT